MDHSPTSAQTPFPLPDPSINPFLYNPLLLPFYKLSPLLQNPLFAHPLLLPSQHPLSSHLHLLQEHRDLLAKFAAPASDLNSTDEAASEEDGSDLNRSVSPGPLDLSVKISSIPPSLSRLPPSFFNAFPNLAARRSSDELNRRRSSSDSEEAHEDTNRNLLLAMKEVREEGCKDALDLSVASWQWPWMAGLVTILRSSRLFDRSEEEILKKFF